jgi:hypothetical protein
MKEVSVFHDSGPIELSVIESFEEKVGYNFPDNYKRLLSKHNELYPEAGFFNFTNKIDDKIDCRDINFLGFGAEVTNASHIERAQEQDNCLRTGVVIFGCSANGDYIGFDYRLKLTSDNPSVVVIFHDYFDDDNKMLISPVAETFEDFINMLYEYDEEEKK